MGRQIESGSVRKHEWGFGKRGLGMTQEGLGALPGLGIRAGRAVVRWNKASRLMRRKTSTDMVNLNVVTHRIFVQHSMYHFYGILRQLPRSRYLVLRLSCQRRSESGVDGYNRSRQYRSQCGVMWNAGSCA